MNAAHYHLIVNHLPIIFPLVGIIIMTIGFFSSSESVKRTAFFIFILGSVSTFAAMATGDDAEDIVEKISGVTENFISIHEETAEKFAIFSYILGALSIGGLWACFK